ncbi:chaplin [Kitasatospora sp. NPDC004669]|uniref:chaplin n=1 Tax=Kitasatospora sp. NPDC004669 TaxID=3154555 RepID=UPI0033A5140D
MKRIVLLAASLGGVLATVCAGPAQAGALAGPGDGGCVNVGTAESAGAAVGSPGVLSGNTVQIPVNAPINLCGNSIHIGAPGNGGGGGNGGGPG